MDYQTRQDLKSFAIYALSIAGVILLAIGVAALENSANVGIEAKCQAQGGQVLRTPGELSRCILPPTR